MKYNAEDEGYLDREDDLLGLLYEEDEDTLEGKENSDRVTDTDTGLDDDLLEWLDEEEDYPESNSVDVKDINNNTIENSGNKATTSNSNHSDYNLNKWYNKTVTKAKGPDTGTNGYASKLQHVPNHDYQEVADENIDSLKERAEQKKADSILNRNSGREKLVSAYHIRNSRDINVIHNEDSILNGSGAVEFEVSTDGQTPYGENKRKKNPAKNLEEKSFPEEKDGYPSNGDITDNITNGYLSGDMKNLSRGKKNNGQKVPPLSIPRRNHIETVKEIVDPEDSSPVIIYGNQSEEEAISLQRRVSQAQKEENKSHTGGNNKSDELSPYGLTPAEKWTGSSRRRGYQYKGQDRNLPKDSATFYTGLNTSRMALKKGEALLDQYLPPVTKKESVKAKKKREKLLERAILGSEGVRRSNQMAFTEKDMEILHFLSIFQYAKADHIKYILNSQEYSAIRRLKRMENFKLVENISYHGVPGGLWTITRNGAEISGRPDAYRGKIKPEEINPLSLSHYMINTYLASNIWGGTNNVLLENNFPKYGRIDRNSNPMPGEHTVSERLVKSSMSKISGGIHKMSKSHYSDARDKAIEEMSLWRKVGLPAGVQSPEFIKGNEWMWTVLPSPIVGKSYHNPDLVLPRERDPETGRPNSLAIEIERGSKTEISYRSTMAAYVDDYRLYGQVVWVCTNRESAQVIRDIGTEIKIDGRPIIEDFLRIIPLVKDGKQYNDSHWLL